MAAGLSFVFPKFYDVRHWLIRAWYAEIWVQLTLTGYVTFLLYRGYLAPSIVNHENRSDTYLKNVYELVGVGLVFVGVVSSAVSAEWRVLADQTNLVGSSLSFHFERAYQNITEGYFYYDSFHPTASGIDNRPPLYSFVISIFHDLFGVNANHGFHVNLLVAFGLGVIFYHLGYQILGRKRYGFLAILIMISWPIVSQVIRSSGFEAINLFFLILFYWQAYKFIQSPSEERFELLLYIFLAASMCRYESLVLVLPCGLLGYLAWKNLSWSDWSPRLLLIPLGFVPLNWQRYLTTSINPGDNPDGGPFGWQYFLPNVRYLGEFIFDPFHKGFPSSPMMASVAFVGLSVFVWRGIKKSLTKAERTMGLVIGLSTLGILVVQCSFYMGDVRQVFQQRFVVSYVPALSVMAVYGFLWFEEELVDRSFRDWALWLLWSGAFALGINGLRHGDIAYQGRWLTLYREYKASLAYLATYPRQNTLFISDRPGMYVVHQYGAISFETANGKLDDLSSDLRRKLYQSILVEQRIYYDPKKEPEPKLKTMENLKLDPVFELQNDADYYMRISKIVLVPEVNLPQENLQAPEKDTKKDKPTRQRSGRSSKAQKGKRDR